MNNISKIIRQGPDLISAKKALILLHGRGGSAQDMLSLAKRFADADSHVIIPEAIRNAWYPLPFLSEENVNEPHLSQSIQSIKDLIEDITKTIKQENVVIMGFSQGACLALEFAARFASEYGAIVAFTGGLIGKILDKSKYKGDLKHTPIFISNGDQDPYIPLWRSQESKQILEELNGEVTLKEYKARPHLILPDEIASATALLKKRRLL